jgi:hypothetical protein
MMINKFTFEGEISDIKPGVTKNNSPYVTFKVTHAKSGKYGYTETCVSFIGWAPVAKGFQYKSGESVIVEGEIGMPEKTNKTTGEKYKSLSLTATKVMSSQLKESPARPSQQTTLPHPPHPPHHCTHSGLTQPSGNNAPPIDDNDYPF